MADQYTRSTFATVRGLNVRYRSAPAMAGAGVAGVALTAGAGAYGAYADLAAAGAITTEFWAVGMSCYTMDAAQVVQAQLYNATLTATLADFEFNPTAVTVNVPPMFVPLPIYCAAGTQIQGRIGGAAAKSINARLIYAIGL